MTNPPVVGAVSADDHRKHLEFIQDVITRMAGASSSAKGWLLPVVTATYGYAITKTEWAVAALGVLAVVLFGFLDANYLKHERSFRELYKAVIKNDSRVPVSQPRHNISVSTQKYVPGSNRNNARQ